ncbi:MAG: hypothetical protein HOO19_02040 [Rhodospirillaceae bacterium]|jgi:hypothetical protein|nr:hypothetical protein [Rhodospirillaceae bacterium]MBT3885843.1 hypothetical protein [Rhodospirillaceae bacterium]MBT4115169.1 hypothetical protein [Rhodospirillaceae bacterium]MBT4670507.1 hypothetical protein [Rhodospirillaceae bacterium]MBT4748082.1 hypothetical protein [Rhodospirillaceae bacterium]
MAKIAGLMIATAAIAYSGLALLSTPNGAHAAEAGTPVVIKTVALVKELEARLDAEMDAELRRLTAVGAADAMCPVDGHGNVSYSGHNPEIVGVSKKSEQVAETGSTAAK